MGTPTFRYQILIKGISLLFMILFVYAATSKLLSYEQFQIQLRKSPFISSYSILLAWMIPFVEYVIVGLFIIPKYISIAFYFSFSILILFTVYIGLVLNLSDHIPCSCGGIISNMGWKEHFVFNISFIILALIGIMILRRHKNNNNLKYST